MKNKFSVFFIIVAFLMIIAAVCNMNYLSISKKRIVEAQDKTSSKAVDFTACRSSFLIDSDSGTIIYSNNEKERLPIASMCKVMTMLICFENIDNQSLSLDESIVVSQNAMSMGGSQVFLEANAEYKVGELLKSICVASANDACVAMAERIAGCEEDFVCLMNDKALALGMENTRFVNCTGLPQVGQYSTAEDVAIMFRELLKHKNYFDYSNIWMDKISHPNDRITSISNTNKLIKFYEGCDSGKTGYTCEAGHCLVASAMRNDLRLISVVLKAPDSKTRFNEVSKMFNFGFNSYQSKVVVDCNAPLNYNTKIKFAKNDNVLLYAKENISVLLKKNEKKSFDIRFEGKNDLVAPLEKNSVVGKLYVFENGIEIKNVDVIIKDEILSKNYIDNMFDVINNWIFN